MKGIDPKYIMYLGLLVTIEQAIGHGTVSLTGIIPADWAPYVTSWCNLLAFIGTTIMTGQAAISSNAPGPLINTPPAAPTIVKILIAAFLLSAFLPMGHAMAQVLPRPRAAVPLTGDLGKDIKTAIDQKNATFSAANPTGPNDPSVSCDFNIFVGLNPKNLEAAIKKCVSDGVGTLVDDTARALDSAQNFKPNPDQDAINCLAPGLAILKAGVILPAVAEVKDANGNITTAGVTAKSPGLILLFQKYREFVLAGGLTSCKTWVDTAVNATATQAINNAVGIGALGAGAALLAPK